MKTERVLYALLFSGLGIFSYLLLVNSVNIQLKESVSSFGFVAFFIIAFNILGFSTLSLSSWINRYYPRYLNSRWKISGLYLLVAFMLLLLNYSVLVSAKLLAGSHQPFLFPNGGVRILLLVWLAELIIISLLLANRSMQSNLDLQKKTAELQKANTTARYQALQNQLNPHFLFNSLNTLIAEIEYDPKGAVEFTRNLSNVYRYVLQCQDKPLVTLEEELEFVQSYIYLHKVRLGDCFDWNSRIPADYQESLLPPLTLQLLIENVLKHNSITQNKPMEIRVTIEKGRLIVSNPVNQKPVGDSPQKGLENLSARCKLALGEDIEIDRSDNYFTVKVPLLYE
ncbi:MAG: histidine kinase [Bacteroidales bacterium]